MVDEPELSMHPKWQKNILRYYKNLFTDNNGVQIAQLFLQAILRVLLVKPCKT